MQEKIVSTLLREHGQTYAEELGIRLESSDPSMLFRLLCAALLYSARIRSTTATKAAKALTEHGLDTPQKMLAARWEERVRILDQAGYVRYDERTSTMLGQTAQLLMDKYQENLNNLRARAELIPERERKLLKEFKGIGDVGTDIFFREVQLVWEELFPFADGRALKIAAELGLEPKAAALAQKVRREDFPKLIAALIRTGLAHDQAGVLEEAETES